MKAVRCSSAFTLLELLVVISIIGILAALTVPALKNFGKSNVSISAARQLLDDIGRARQLAISQHSTVYMVFVPGNFWDRLSGTNSTSILTTNLCDKQYTGYNFISYGQLGDQPGQHQWHYLSSWQNLPDGAFIATNKFEPPNLPLSSLTQPLYSQWNQDYPHNDQNRVYGFQTNGIPFPGVTSPLVPLQYIAFNYLGQLTTNGVDESYTDEYIPLAQGSVIPARDANKALQLLPAQVNEIPPGNSTNISYNIIHVDAITGRAVLEFYKMK